jgi:hypothetical protein
MKFVAEPRTWSGARPSRPNASVLVAFTLIGAAAIAPKPASACAVQAFVINSIDKRSAKIAVGQSVDFYVYFKIVVDASSAIQSNSQIGSLKIDYGDGTAQDTGVQTFDPTVTKTWNFGGVPMKAFTHAYLKPGAFVATVRGGRTQPCAIEPGLASVTVNASPVVVALDSKRNPADRHVLIPGRIERAAMLLSGPTAYVQIDGSGTCSLKVSEELGGTALQQYDYNGPLPTKIWIRPTAHYVNDPYYSVAYGTHALKVDGIKSSDGCAGTASASWTVQTPRRAPSTGPTDSARTSAITPSSRNASLLSDGKAAAPAGASSATASLMAVPSPFGTGGPALTRPAIQIQTGRAAFNPPPIPAPAAARSGLQRADAVSLNPQPLPPAGLTTPVQAPSAFR